MLSSARPARPPVGSLGRPGRVRMEVAARAVTVGRLPEGAAAAPLNVRGATSPGAAPLGRGPAHAGREGAARPHPVLPSLCKSCIGWVAESCEPAPVRPVYWPRQPL